MMRDKCKNMMDVRQLNTEQPTGFFLRKSEVYSSFHFGLDSMYKSNPLVNQIFKLPLDTL